MIYDTNQTRENNYVSVNSLIRPQKRGGASSALRISRPADPAEIEADKVAEAVISRDACDLRHEQAGQSIIQTKATNGTEISSDTAQQISNLSGGSPLRDEERKYFEPRFGADFSGVKVHTDSNASRMAESIDSRAFTKDNNIVFSKGEYQPGTSEGNKLIAHELAHVVQQNPHGVSRKDKPKNDSGNTDYGLSEDLLLQWNENFASHTVKSDKFLLKIHGKLTILKDYIDKVDSAYQVLNILLYGSVTDSPKEQVLYFKKFLDALKEWMPYLPGIYEILASYSAIIGGIAEGLGKIAENIRAQEAGFLVIHPGVWPGGWELYNFIVKLMKSKTPIDVPEPVISWVKKNNILLTYATGEQPPAFTRTLFGIDMFWPDYVNKAELKGWFYKYRKEVKQFVYGSTALELDEYL